MVFNLADFDDIFVPKPKNKIVIFENELDDPDEDDINKEVMLLDLPYKLRMNIKATGTSLRRA